MYAKKLYTVTSQGIQVETYFDAQSFQKAFSEKLDSDDAVFEDLELAMIFAINCLCDRLTSLEKAGI